MEENTIYDYSILKGKIVEKIGSRRELAEKLGINETTLSNKLNNKTDFSREEMKKILILLWETKSPLHMFGKGIVIIN